MNYEIKFDPEYRYISLEIDYDSLREMDLSESFEYLFFEKIADSIEENRIHIDKILQESYLKVKTEQQAEIEQKKKNKTKLFMKNLGPKVLKKKGKE